MIFWVYYMEAYLYYLLLYYDPVQTERAIVVIELFAIYKLILWLFLVLREVS